MSSGWGGGGWGLAPWGSGSDGLRVVSAQAIRENCIRISFSEPPRYTRDLDANDASNPRRFSVTTVPGTIGLDDAPVRPVRPCRVDVSQELLAGGASLDVWVDRHMTAWPSQYVISANQLVSGAGLPLDADFTSAPLYGLQWVSPPNIAELAAPRRDFAQPDSLAALLDPIGSTAADLLGTLPIDATGDYATDDGITTYKKRILRRLTTRKGAFLHMPDYGVGVLEHMKRVGYPDVRATIVSDAEVQVRQEPETITCSVKMTLSPDRSAWFLVVRATTKSFGFVSLAAPFSPTAT